MTQLTNTPPSESVFRLEARKSFALSLWFENEHDAPFQQVDITGATVQFDMAKKPHKGGTSVISQAFTIDGSIGLAQLNLQAEDLNLVAGLYDFMVTFVTVDNFSLPVMKGEVEILANAGLNDSNIFSGFNPSQSLAVKMKANHTVVVKVSQISAGLEIGDVTTLSPGSPASASIRGRYPKQFLDLGIPRGSGGSGGGGGGAVDSVNFLTGDVLLTQDTIGDGVVAKQYTAIEKTKLAGVAAGATVNQSDATVNAAIALKKADSMATNRVLGRTTAGTGSIEEIVIGSGLALASGTLTATGVAAADATTIAKGVVELATNAETVTGTDAVRATTPAGVAAALAVKKTDSMSTNKLLGRGTAATGAIEELSLGTGLSLAGTTLNASVASVNAKTGTVVLTQDDVADGTTNKVYSNTEKTKLAGIATAATANQSDSTTNAAIAAKKTDSMSTNKLLGRGTASTGAIEEITIGSGLTLTGTTLSSSGGGGAVSSVNAQTGVVVLTQDDIGNGGTNKVYTSTEKTKLAGIATAATANQSDATTNAAIAAKKTDSMAANRLIGRASGAGTGALQEITIGTGLSLSSGGVLNGIDNDDLKDLMGGALSDATNIPGGNIEYDYDYPTHTAEMYVTGLLASQIDDHGGFKITTDAQVALLDDFDDSVNAALINYGFDGLGDGKVLLHYNSGLSVWELTANMTADQVTDGTTYKRFSATEKTKLAGLATVATSGSAADLTGILPTASLPPLAITTTTVVANQTAMLALTAQEGDVAIRTDTGKTYILSTNSPSTLADWKELTASGAVQSVNSKTGTVTLNQDDIASGTTNKAYTAAEQTKLATAYVPSGTDVAVADGGTGRSTSTTAYGLIAAGTTATGVQQTVSPGTAGQLLVSAGSSALPAFGVGLTIVPSGTAITGYPDGAFLEYTP